MAISVAELEDLRDELIRARARGARTVQVAGEKVEYGTDAEMVAAIGDLERRIRQASAGGVHSVRFGASKGV